jgi:hypothetical protein
MNPVFRAFIDLEDVKVIGIRMLLAAKDFANHEVIEPRLRSSNPFDFDAGEGELIRDLLRG